jgi:hypothetical protein
MAHSRPRAAKLDKRCLTIWLMISLMATAILICLAIAAGFWLLRPPWASPQITPYPSLACSEPTLTLGGARFRIESLARPGGGSTPIPPEQSGVANWVGDSMPHYVFVLNPTPENLVLVLSAQTGTPLVIQWTDCEIETYFVKAVRIGQTELEAFFTQPTAGATLLIQDGSGGWVVLDSGQPEPLQAVETPAPEEQNPSRAELSFLDTAFSPDGKTLTFTISIRNMGATPLTLTTADISLTPEDAPSLPLLNVEPTLPQSIEPGMSQSFYLTFAAPPSGPALLRILDFSAEFYF